jgi:hypothetical protein
MDINRLSSILESGSRQDLERYCIDNDLEIRDEKIYPKDPNLVKQQTAFWDKRQLVKKINLNS